MSQENTSIDNHETCRSCRMSPGKSVASDHRDCVDDCEKKNVLIRSEDAAVDVRSWESTWPARSDAAGDQAIVIC